MADSWDRVRALQQKPLNAEVKQAIESETAAYQNAYERATLNRDQAMKVLCVDESAAPVLDALKGLPYAPLMHSPRDDAVNQAWDVAYGELKRAVFEYVGVLRERLTPPADKVAG
jgi:hypothetical protein